MKKKRFTVKASSSAETYYVALDSAGRVASSGSTENPKSLSQLRNAGRKVKTFKSYEEYSKFLDQCYDSMKEQSSMSKKEVGASRSAKRRFTVTASSKRKAIGAGYTPKGRKVLWLFNADENQWVPWGTWSRDTVTEDEMYSLSHRRFPNSEYDADYNYTDYVLLPNDGSEPDDGRPVRASAAPKRKFTVKAASGSENIICAEKSDTIVIFYDGNFVSSGGWDGVRGGIHYIVSRDDAALKACIDYCNSFGDPLIGEDFASPRDVADTMADVIAAEYNDAWDSDEFFIHIPVSGTRGIEIFDKADMAVHASTAVKCSYEEEVFHLYGYDEDGADVTTGYSDSEMGLEDEIGNLFAYDSVDTVDIYENGISGYGDYIGTITRAEYDSDSTGRLLELLGMRDAAVESAKDVKCSESILGEWTFFKMIEAISDYITIDLHQNCAIMDYGNDYLGEDADAPYKKCTLKVRIDGESPDGTEVNDTVYYDVEYDESESEPITVSIDYNTLLSTNDFRDVIMWISDDVESRILHITGWRDHQRPDYAPKKGLVNSSTEIKCSDDEVERLWESFADVPMNPETEEIEEDFMEFPAGTKREDVWHWFDKNHSKGIANLLYGKEDIKCAFRDDTIDKEAVRELVLVITNDGDLYRQRTTPMIENLKKKVAKGKYDRELAVKLWQYLADEGVRRYDKEYGSGRGSVSMLNPATRRAIAEELRDYYEEQIMWDVEHANDGKDELTTL